MNKYLKFFLYILLIVFLINVNVEEAEANGMGAYGAAMGKFYVSVISIGGTIVIAPLIDTIPAGISYGICDAISKNQYHFEFKHIYTGALIGGYAGLLVGGIFHLMFWDLVDNHLWFILPYTLFYLSASIAGGYIAYYHSRSAVGTNTAAFRSNRNPGFMVELPLCIGF